MGFFDSLFGGGKQEEKPKRAAATQPQPAAVAPETTQQAGIPGDVIAVIAAAIAAYTGSTEGMPAIRIQKANKTWATYGLQEIMAARKI